LFKADEDALLARFRPIRPEPAPLRRPRAWADDALIDGTLARLVTLDLVIDEGGARRPRFAPFAEDARALMDDFRATVRGSKAAAEGLFCPSSARCRSRPVGGRWCWRITAGPPKGARNPAKDPGEGDGPDVEPSPA
jgi:hypothetical protein